MKTTDLAMTSMLASQSPDVTAMTQSPTTEGSGASSQGPVVIAVVVIVVIVLIIVAASVFAWWMYSKRRKQRHDFHGKSASQRLETSQRSLSEHNSTFRVLSTWEDALRTTDKNKDAEAGSPYPTIGPVHVSFCTPDLIAGTSESEISQRHAHDAMHAPEVTFAGAADDRPRSSEFENPTFDMDLEGIFNNSLFNSPNLFDRQISAEERMSQNANFEDDIPVSSKRSSLGIEMNTSSPETRNSAVLTEPTGLERDSNPLAGIGGAETEAALTIDHSHNNIAERLQDDSNVEDVRDDHVVDHTSHLNHDLVNEMDDEIIGHAPDVNDGGALINELDMNESSIRGIENAAFEMDSELTTDIDVAAEDTMTSIDLEDSR